MRKRRRDPVPKLTPGAEEDQKPIFDPDRSRNIGNTDPLRRRRWIEVLERQIMDVPLADSLVFSLEGPWGAGKTSVLDTIEADFSDQHVAVVRFNPWLFAGAEDLVGCFFHEITAQLAEKKSRLKEIAKVFAMLAATLGSLAVAASSETLARMGRATGQASEGVGQASELQRIPSLLQTKRELARKLIAADTRIIVLVDDLERLAAREALDVLRAVRAIADLPTVVYVLAFDRVQLADSLRKAGEDPRFLDKIIQIPVRLPSPPSDALRQLLTTRLDAVISVLPHADLDQQHWSLLANEVVLGLISTPRDIVRISNAVAAALAHIGDRVALEEVIALETLRILEPAFFFGLRDHRVALTTGRDPRVELQRAVMQAERRRNQAHAKNSSPTDPSTVRRALSACAMNTTACENALRMLFPALEDVEPQSGPNYNVRKLRIRRRVAITEVFDLYFEAEPRADVIDLALVAALAQAELDAAFQDTLRAISSEQLPYLFNAIADHAGTIAYRPDAADFLLEMLAQAARLPIGATSAFVEPSEPNVARCVLRVLKEIPRLEDRIGLWQAAVNKAQGPAVGWLAEVSDRLRRGHHWTQSLGLQSTEVSMADEVLRRKLTGLDAAGFLATHNPGWLLRWAFQPMAVHRRRVLDLLSNQQLFLRYVKDSLTQRSSSTGVSFEFASEPFADVWNDETDLRERLEALVKSGTLGQAESTAVSDALRSVAPLLVGNPRANDDEFEDDEGDVAL